RRGPGRRRAPPGGPPEPDDRPLGEDGRARAPAPRGPRAGRAPSRPRALRHRRVPAARGGLPALVPLPRERRRALPVRRRPRPASVPGPLCGLGARPAAGAARGGLPGERAARAGARAMTAAHGMSLSVITDEISPDLAPALRVCGDLGI